MKSVKDNERIYKPSICISGTRFSVIERVAKSSGWRIVNDSQLWNIGWTDAFQGIDVFKEMKRFQKINHFPGMIEICRKDLLARNLSRMLQIFPNDFNFFPKTWCFPADLGDAITYSKKHKSETYILKPNNGAQGRGIRLTKKLTDINATELLTCQVYINQPLLVDGYKFDLRVYALITSIDPLRIFVYREGLARFATAKYRPPTNENTNNVYMHLTNYSVNKRNHTFSTDHETGSKRKTSSVNRLMVSEGIDADELWKNIDDCIVKTILSAWPVLKHNYNACFSNHDVMQACFEILGFDILIDSRMKPYVLEVNHSPSFHTEEQIDREVKESLIRDTLNILNVQYIDKRKILVEDQTKVRDRLLKVHRRDNAGSTGSTKEHSGGDSSLQEETECLGTPDQGSEMNAMSRQIDWEEQHLGGFRRIMPDPEQPQRYAKYFTVQNQASIFQETVASKKRREAATKLRNEISEKATLDRRLNMNRKSDVNKKILNGKMLSEKGAHERLQGRRGHLKPNIMLGHWFPHIISNIEEQERINRSLERDDYIRKHGVLEKIYESFYQHQLLSESDRIRYAEFYEKLQKMKEDDNSLENLYENESHTSESEEFEIHLEPKNFKTQGKSDQRKEILSDFLKVTGLSFS